MELKVWAKTMLTVQRHLGKVTKALDHVIYKKAIASMFVNSKNLHEHSSEAVSKFIINLMDSKINLINLNTICVNGLKKIDKTCAKILILKHIDGRTSNDIAKLLGLSDRTYFRRLNKAYEEFENYLRENNFTDEYFIKRYSSEGWIMEVHDKCLEFFESGNSENEIFSSNFDCLRIIKNIKKSIHSSYS